MLFKTLLIALIGASLLTKRVIASSQDGSDESPSNDDDPTSEKEHQDDVPSSDESGYDSSVFNPEDETTYDSSYEINYALLPNEPNYYDVPEKNYETDESYDVKKEENNDDNPKYDDDNDAETSELQTDEEVKNDQEIDDREYLNDEETSNDEIKTEQETDDDEELIDPQPDTEYVNDDVSNDEEAETEQETDDDEELIDPRPDTEYVNDDVSNDEEAETEQETDDDEELIDPRPDTEYVNDDVSNDEEAETEQETDDDEELIEPRPDTEYVNDEVSNDEEAETEQETDDETLIDPPNDKYENDEDESDVEIETEQVDNLGEVSDPQADDENANDEVITDDGKEVSDQQTDDDDVNDEIISDDKIEAQQPNNDNEVSDPQTDDETVNDELNSDEVAEAEQEANTNVDQNDDQDNIGSVPSLICPEGWFLYENSNTCYYISSSTQNWDDSQSLCINLDGSLASFHSAEETKFVEDHLTNSAWIGLIDKKEKGMYAWSDGTIFNFNNWADGEPSLYFKVPLFGSLFSREKCVEMKKSKSFRWNDEVCSSYRQAICSRKPEQVPRTECPEGWLSDGGKLCYKLSSIKTDYETAVEYCSLTSIGASLVAPSNDVQNQFFANLIKEKRIQNIWIGVDDIEEEDEFTGVGGSVQDYFNWDKKEPSQFIWFDEDCVQINKNGKWSDEDCDDQSHFICVAHLI